MLRKETAPSQEQFDFRHSYVRDGVMRAYANRFAVLAFVSGAIALLSLGFAIYVRLQPPTIIRITPNGEANVISGRPLFHKRTPAVLANAATSPEPMDYEKQRIVQDFVDDYLNYDFKNVGRPLGHGAQPYHRHPQKFRLRCDQEREPRWHGASGQGPIDL